MKRLAYIIIGLLGMITAQAQNIKERIHVETDKDFYLAGEQMGLKLHATDALGKPQAFSRIAYVELLGDKENTVRLKVEMKNASGEAAIQLPYTLASGVYDLVAYTRWMRNEGEQVFFRRQIGVFNSLRYIRNTDQLVFMEGEAPVSATLPDNVGIQIKTDKPQYGNREKVTLSMEDFPQNAHLSVSVARKDIGLEKEASPTVMAEKGDKTYQPELEGLILEARLEGTEENEPVVRPNLTIQGDRIRYYAGQQATDGSVHFYTTPLHGVTEVVTATGGKGHLQPLSPFVATPPTKMRPITLYRQDEKALKERSIALQTTDYFYPEKEPNTVPIEGRLSSIAPKWRFDLDHYKRFSTFEETFIEFMPCVKVTGTKGNRRIVAFDSDEQATSNGNTLVLIDGVTVMDHELLLAYSPHLVKMLEVYVEDFVFGNQVYNGILSVKTPNLKLSGFNLPRTSVIYGYEGVHLQSEMYQPSAAGSIPAHMPDLRHTLYWNPNVTAKDNLLTFQTSDMCGTYIVKVEGRTQEGEKVIGYTSFLVE